MYKDHINIFSKNEKETSKKLETLRQTIRIFIQNIGMEFLQKILVFNSFLVFFRKYFLFFL